MSQDPNWFFSTLSQSAAAIIGLLGGIVLSRLIGELATAGESKSKLLSDFESLRGGFEPILTRMSDYVQYVGKNAPSIGAAILKCEPELQQSGRPGTRLEWTTQEYMELGGQKTSFAEPTRIPVNRLMLSRMQTEGQTFDDIVQFWSPISAVRDVADVENYIAGYLANWHPLRMKIRKNASQSPLIPSVPDDLEKHVQQLSNFVQRCRAHRASVLPIISASRLVLFLLITFSCSLLIPLLYLESGRNLTPKVVLFIVFAAGVAGLLAYFWRIVGEFRKVGDLRLL